MAGEAEKLELAWLPDRFAVVRLDPDVPTPDWAARSAASSFVSVTRTAEELSIIAPQELVPKGATAERDFVAFRVVGKLEFSTVGVLAKLTGVLAEANISVVAVSTFDTDYILLKADNQDRATSALQRAGLTFRIE